MQTQQKLNQIPCLKHEGSYLLFIKKDKEKTEYVCEKCCMELEKKNSQVKFSKLIHIKNAFKSPSYLLSKLNIPNCRTELLIGIENYNDKTINNILADLKTQISNIQNTLEVIYQEVEKPAQQFLSIRQKINDELEKIMKFDQFKQIAASLGELGDSNNRQTLQQNEKLLHLYLQDLTKNDCKELDQSLIDMMGGVQQQLQDLNKGDQFEQNNLKQQFKSFYISQIDLVKQINLVKYCQIYLDTFESQLLPIDYQKKIIHTIQSKLNKFPTHSKLVYVSTRDELYGQQFWNKINDLSNLLFIFKSQSGNIFGGFSTCKWANLQSAYIEDSTQSSFLFSQTHDQIYPLIKGQEQCAIYCNASLGPTFGSGHDISIAADFKCGYSNLGSSYQVNQYKISDIKTHLFGQLTPNIVECEIWGFKFE